MWISLLRIHKGLGNKCCKNLSLVFSFTKRFLYKNRQNPGGDKISISAKNDGGVMKEFYVTLEWVVIYLQWWKVPTFDSIFFLILHLPLSIYQFKDKGGTLLRTSETPVPTTPARSTRVMLNVTTTLWLDLFLPGWHRSGPWITSASHQTTSRSKKISEQIIS